MAELDAGGAGSALGKQAGPFTVGQWLLIGGAGIGAGMLLRRTSLFAGFAQAPAPTLDDASPDALAGPTGVTGAGGTVGLPQYAGGTPVPSGPQTNEQWIAAGVQFLTHTTPPVDALTADTGLRRYLQNLSLNSAQSNAVRMVIAQLGTPPEGAPPAVVVPDQPVQPPKPKLPPEFPGGGKIRPAGNRRITGDGRATPAALSRFFYGSNAWWVIIRDANPTVVKDAYTPIPKGKVIIVP